ncbi:MAG TPA: MBL fold metallo-hydrolase [Gemmatimonadales bacterium]|jgi:glyoxylase-like metal-dependent hydrolase (beta-lactamase superfamily II)
MLLEHQGIEGLRVGRFDLGISAACILYRVGSTVIDTGPPNQWRVVRRFLRERRVARVLITHHHEDHAGNGARCLAELGARVYLPEAGLRPAMDGFPLRAYQRVLWGAPRRFEPEPVPRQTDAGDGVRLRAIPAPGHSPDMTCYLEPERGWLFAGDLYIASKPRFMRADETVDDQIASLRSVLALDFATVFCAHRGVVVEGRRAIEAKLDYLVSLRDQVRDLHDRGHSIARITRTLLGRETAMSLLTMYHFSKRNLVRACLG